MTITKDNLFADIPDHLKDELIETILQNSNFRIERIAMSPKFKKRSALKFVGRIISGAKRRGKANAVKFKALVELSQERSDVGFETR